MRRTTALAGLALVIALSLQDPAFARRHGRGRRGGGFGGTAASAAMMGYAAMMRAQGAQNLANSQAAINWQKAKTAEIQNRLLWTETYFRMRKVNHDMRSDEHLAAGGAQTAAAEAAALARAASVPPLDAAHLDQTSGQITYPDILRDHLYDDLREDVDAFFKRRSATHGSVDFEERQQVETILDLWHTELMGHISRYAAGDYGHAITFLEQLKNESRKPVR